MDRPSSRDQFAPVASAYLSSDAHKRPDEIAAILDEYDVGSGWALDVGTGAGHLAYELARRIQGVVAFDLTPEMLSIVRGEAASLALSNISLVQGDAERMPFADNLFSGVGCRVAAHHFLDVKSFVRESVRVTVPGGWFLIIDTVSPEEDVSDKQLNHLETLRDPSHIRNWRPSEWRSMLESQGMKVVSETLGVKRMDFDAWLDRMRVGEAARAEIEPLVWSTTNPVHAVVKPAIEGGKRMFELPELVMLARKQN